MASSVNVALVGATGQTGSLIVNGLLESSTGTKFNVTALARQESLDSDPNKALRNRGVEVVAVDLLGPKDKLVQILYGIDVVISCIYFSATKNQIPLAEAAKEAGVKRFVPCHFGTPAPRGISMVNDWKHEVLDAIQRIHLPYTVIDVGWWMEQTVSISPLPSGRTDHAIQPFAKVIPGDGTVCIAVTSAQDIGLYVVQIILDSRTTNQKVFAYTEVLSYNDIADLIDELSGEKGLRSYVAVQTIRKEVSGGLEVLKHDPTASEPMYKVIVNQYLDSWGIRGDNTPKMARYLGYLDFKELYPDVKCESIKAVIKGILGPQC